MTEDGEIETDKQREREGGKWRARNTSFPLTPSSLCCVRVVTASDVAGGDLNANAEAQKQEEKRTLNRDVAWWHVAN